MDSGMHKKKYIVLTISLLLLFILEQNINADSYMNDSKKIENQYVVVLKSTASNQTLNLLIEEVTMKGVKIIAIYDEPILKGFAFFSGNVTITNHVIDFLNSQPEVDYVIADKEASIF